INLIKKYNIIEVKGIEDYSDYKKEIKSEVKFDLGVIKKIDDTNLTNNYVCHLNSKDIKLPLFVRNRRKGDYIEILGLNGKKKVKDIFINEKVPKDIRDKYPIVVDSNDNIVWIPGLKKSKYDVLKTKNYDIILWYIKEAYNE
ncbi:MAG: tRNA lysidine(34) synthetase TilS, partial [Bacilli bacterium]|nr:tRNA lysidine(34) synthetase TilS [Bacilli bacterium]